MTFKGKTFCCSPLCVNECGRKMTAKEKYEASISEEPVSYSYFCDGPDPMNEPDARNDKST